LLKFVNAEEVKKENATHVYILMEYCEDGSLFDMMARKDPGRFTEEEIMPIVKQICE
jgi:serine/threonine protein kinase